jgi:hypothetical protein
MTNHRERSIMTNHPEATICDGCRLIPLTHLSLDVSEPVVVGWEQLFAERGVEIVLDDIGRPSVPRQVLGELLAERREREARLEDQRRRDAEHADKQVPVMAGVPALEGASPFESMAAADPDFTTPRDEFGRPRPSFLADELAEGNRK